MPKITDMLPSSYLKQADIDTEYIVTITKLERKNVARDDDEPELKWLMHFAEFDKPMVLNSTNIQLTAQACKSDDTDDWIGQEVIVYTDPNVSFGGKLVGGLRIKAKQAPAKPATPRRPLPPQASTSPRTPGAPAWVDEDVPLD